MNHNCSKRIICRSHSSLTKRWPFLKWNWHLSWLHHNPFRATLPTSLLITQSWRNRGVNETKKFFHGLWARNYFKGFSTVKFFSSVTPFKCLFLSTWVFFIVFYNDTYNFLQGFNYLINYPRGNCFHLRNTAFQLFQLFGFFFFFLVFQR